MMHHFSYTFSEASRLYKQAKDLNDMPYEINKAISLLENSIKIYPDYTEAHFELGRLNEKSGNYEGARREYNKAIVLNPFFARAYYHLAMLCEEKLGDFENAKLNYKKAVEVKINYSEAFYRLALLTETHYKDYENARNYYLSAFKLRPSNKNITYRLARLLHEKSIDHLAAKKYYLKTIETDPKFAEAYYFLSKLCAENLNNKEKGKEYYIKASKLNHSLRSEETDKYFGIDRENKNSFIQRLFSRIAS